MRANEDRTDRALDDALEMTFPASDPIAVYIKETDVDAEAFAHEAKEKI